MQYQLKIQQLVTYAKSRVYRNFIRALSDNENIRLNGESNLFYFMTLCSYANFRTSTFRIDAVRYTLAPGEWMMPVRELMKIYRKKTEKGTVAVLERLQQSNHIHYELLHHRRYVKFRINDWSKFNSTIEATAPCGFGCSPNTGRTSGFFFFPYKMVSEFIGKGKCSEMDILLDLWLNAIYNDERIAGSDVGPVVYYRNGTHSPLTGYEDLGKRWGISKSTAGRILRKLEENSYIKLVAFPGKYGTAIYLQNYLSTMFNISDITIDKEEVALALNIRINIPEETSENTIEMIEELLDSACQNCENTITDDQISVPETVSCVPELHLRKIVRKTAKVLCLQGLTCASCTHARYYLSPLSDDCKRKSISTEYLIRCPGGGRSYKFKLDIEPITESEEN